MKSLFLSDDPRNLEEYNDIPLPLEESIMEFARNEAKRLNIDIDEQYIK